MQKEFESAINNIANREEDISTFSFEINLTDACNYDCTYCFEKRIQKRPNELNKYSDLIIERVDQLLKDVWFKSVFRGIKIDFWGGEPTLNLPLMEKIVNHFEHDERVKFFLYTNGSRIDKVVPLLKKFIGKKYLGKSIPRFDTQISFDGNPIHDLCRISSTGAKTAHVAQDAMRKLYKNEIGFNIKSTVTPDTFRYMSDAWDDVRILHDRYWKWIRYAPTIDYFGEMNFQKHKPDLEESLIDMAAKEIDFIDINGYPLLSWFKGEKRHCGSGKNMCSLDVDGSFHICHGCVYSDEKDIFKFGTLFDEDLPERLKHNFSVFKSNITVKECEECEATFCVRCPVVKYTHSKKEELLDRFYDYTAQSELCKYYKLVGKISRALNICAHGGM
jgi:sulfatase maturation enzyme AslB (radical SAM superfamily)